MHIPIDREQHSGTSRTKKCKSLKATLVTYKPSAKLISHNKATWDGLMYQIYVRQAIEAGLKDSDEGRTIEVREVRKRFGLIK